MPDLTGKMLGKVHVDMFLAKGGMAEVYLGTHTTLHRPVAVKFLKADLQEEPELLERFEREARVIAMLRHPNIVQVFDFDSHLNQPYLVMEYIPGPSLGSYLRALHKKNERLDYLQILGLLNKLADALTYAHKNNVIHRDVKPTNILLTSNTTPVSEKEPLPNDVEPILTDFGLVRFTQSNTRTRTGAITGTPAYMSPEQARGEQVDTRTDVYSLGITLYEMLAGRVPFESDTTLSVLHKHIYEPHPPIEGLPRDLQAVLDRALAKDPDDRYQTPLEFAQAFEQVLSGTTEAETMLLPSPAERSVSKTLQSPDPPAPRSGRNLIFPWMLGVFGLVVAAGALLFVFRPVPPAGDATRTPALTAHSGQDLIPAASLTAPAEPPLDASDPIGLLRFQDGSAEADQVTFISGNLPPPAQGSQYEAWLIDDVGESLFSIGVIQFDPQGRASLTFADSSGRNLLTFYHGLQITVEPDQDSNPNPSNDVAFSASLPPGGFSHVRHLLSAFASTPGQTPFIRGLRRDTELLNDLAQRMLGAFEAGDEESMRLRAEEMLNLILGAQSPDRRDWNANGTIEDPGDGFGLLLNGSNVGYIQGTFSHADLALSSADATGNMLVHGEHVKIAATNISEWTPLMRDQLIAVIEAPSLPEAEGAVRQAVVLANRILNGVDVNGNENIEAIPGEGGALTAYEHSYYMADIFLRP